MKFPSSVSASHMQPTEHHNKLYEGLSCLFDTQDAPDPSPGEDLIGFGSDELVEDYIESFLNSSQVRLLIHVPNKVIKYT